MEHHLLDRSLAESRDMSHITDTIHLHSAQHPRYSATGGRWQLMQSVAERLFPYNHVYNQNGRVHVIKLFFADSKQYSHQVGAQIKTTYL